MADSLTRPTPSLLARPRPTPPYNRSVWERAVLTGGLQVHARLLALVLAHHAGDSGHIPAGHVQDARNLAPEAGMSGKVVRISLNFLMAEGYISRPSILDWTGNLPRPVTLTMPPGDALVGVRMEPPHTGEPR
ncbi:hypothetical protein [Streptomyces sp. AK08-02]|uniref:hypothetical protein n=1 Tax=Streptomyces sp. AK08-02 TaxID=3028654 RepID=UPI0029B2A39B|nr:hypothetical protein [Streptomyces sp. AK08-02]MDX3748703.1 hypothetical protein [Streptomyces sp. AK08-02]